MDAINQQWYEADMTGRDQNTTFMEGEYGLFPQTGQNGNSASSSTYYTTADALAAGFAVPDLPPSLRAAAANIPFAPTYDRTARDSVLFGTAYTNDASDQAAASAPLSFHNRSLQLALPQMQYDGEDFPHEIFHPELSFSTRADSAIGGYDDIPQFRGLEDSRLYTSSTEPHDEQASGLDPLQYHLIRTKSRVTFKESVHTLTPPHGSPEAAPRSTSSSDNRTVSCRLCTDKHYTGVWAHRNLSRHMDSAHAHSSSPDGVKHIRCSYEYCDRTFRREDARLVHERRSHPELMRPPPTRRKRSGEL